MPLPTGVGKSMIYTIFALASKNMRPAKTCVLVISLLEKCLKLNSHGFFVSAFIKLRFQLRCYSINNNSKCDISVFLR